MGVAPRSVKPVVFPISHSTVLICMAQQNDTDILFTCFTCYRKELQVEVSLFVALQTVKA